MTGVWEDRKKKKWILVLLVLVFVLVISVWWAYWGTNWGRPWEQVTVNDVNAASTDIVIDSNSCD